MLIGTFHFGATTDAHRTAFPDLFSTRRQAELQQLATQLAALHPTKFFVENEPRQQVMWDSVYARYQRSPDDTVGRRNEIVQVAMRTARLAGLPRVTCVDHQQALPYKQLNDFAERIEHDTATQRRIAAYKLLALPYPYPKQTHRLADHTVTEQLLYVSSRAGEASNRADYFVYSPNYGVGDDYTGVSFITSWYERNAKIFTNILRATDPTDKVVILLIGSAHLMPLRHYFQQHPYFEVVELAQALGTQRPPARAARRR